MKFLTKQYIDEIYELLGYIQNTGDSYIDTGITPSENTGINVVYEYPSLDNSSAGITGTYIGSGKGTLFVSSVSGSLGSTKIIVNHRGGTKQTSSNIAVDTEYTAKINWLNDGIIDINGATSTQGSDAVNTTELRIFSRYNSTNSTWAYSHAKVKRYQVSDGTSIVRDFVPARRKPDNSIGMLDMVNKVFYPNAGTGTFTGGSSIIINKKHIYKKPIIFDNAYVQLSYLESTGTQYLRVVSGEIDDTYGIKMNASMIAESDNYPAGSTDNSANNRMFYFGARTTLNAWCYGWGSVYTGSSTPRYLFAQYPAGIDKFYTGCLNFLNDKNVSFENETPVTMSGSTQTFTNTDILLFRSYQYNTYACKSRIKWAKISKGSDIIRDLVPVKRMSDGELGMYDKLSGTFYTNQGTDTFVAGPVIGVNYLSYFNEENIYDDVEYLESNYDKNSSLYQYIDTGKKINFSKDNVISGTFMIPDTSRKVIMGGYEANKANMSIEVTDDQKIRLYFTRVSVSQPVLDLKTDEVYPLNTIILYKFTWDATNTTYTLDVSTLDGTVKSTLTGTAPRSGTSNGTRTMCMFLDQYRVASPDADFNGKFRIYQTKWIEDGVTIFNFIPKKMNRLICFANTVDKTVFENKGTGQFGIGRKIYEVEYLTLDGTQRFNTKFYPNTLTTTYKTHIKPTSLETFPFGVRKISGYGGSSAIYIAPVVSGSPNGYFRLDWVSGVGALKYNLGAMGTDYEIEVTGNYAKINGTEITADTATSYDQTDPFVIGNCRTSSTQAYQSGFIGDIHYGQLLNTTTRELYRDYIPAIDENNSPFLFDWVTHTILETAQGQATLTYGPRVIRVEYLYGGSPNRITTLGLTFANHKWETDVKFEGDGTGVALFGTQTGAANYWGSSSIGNAYILHTSSTSYWIYLDTKVKRTVCLDCEDLGSNQGQITMTVDGQSVSRSATSGYNTTTGYRLFNAAGDTYNGKSYLYGNRCYDRLTDELLQNLIPAKDENGEGYMFDTITHVAFRNNGTGTIKCGGRIW